MRSTSKPSSKAFITSVGCEERVAKGLQRVFLASVIGCVGSVFAAPTALLQPPVRDLQQLQDDVQRFRLERDIEALQKQRRDSVGVPEPVRKTLPDADFRFQLNTLDHTPSVVLSAEEIKQAVASFIGREVTMSDLQSLLDAINALYRAKGYVVCEARLAPQRIRQGHLFVTLIEGRTGEVAVHGAQATSPNFVLNAFDLQAGSVANYRQMSEDLVHFNMTHDVELRVDIRAGKETGTTDYAFQVTEPPNWTASIFADSSGSEGTGRLRGGLSVTNRSLLGRRDALTLLGLFSEGSSNLMVTYGMPITSRGTKLLANASLGSVEVVDGPSADANIEGELAFYSLRLEHPFYVNERAKWTAYGEWSRQESETTFHNITINDTQIDAWRLGVEALSLAEQSVLYGALSWESARSDEMTFNQKGRHQIVKGNALWRYQFAPTWRLALMGGWQTVLGGDPLMSSQYFYLGQTSGVRGYDNDFLSAEKGAYINTELTWLPWQGNTSVFAFLDAGRLGNDTAYVDKSLLGTGLGLSVPVWEGALMTATAAFPLKKRFSHTDDVDSVRFNFSFTATW